MSQPTPTRLSLQHIYIRYSFLFFFWCLSPMKPSNTKRYYYYSDLNSAFKFHIMRFLHSFSLGTVSIKTVAMSRKSSNSSRRHDSKSRSSPLLPVGLIILGALLLIAYSYSGSGESGSKHVSRVEGDFSCTLEVERAIPLLKKAYGDSMHKVLHVGPDSCSLVSKLLKEEETEAWGVEPYDIEDADSSCKGLVHKGIVRVADIKFPLPYRPKSFSLVLVTDALDYLSPKYLNKTLPDLARVSADGLVVFTGFPGQQRAKVAEVSKFGRAAKLRSSSWWIRYFVQTSLEENEAAIKKFAQAAIKQSYNPGCQIFHLKSYQ